MAGRLANKVAIVTGGNSGIGAAIAAGFCNEGAVTWIADVSLDANRKSAQRLGDNAHGVQLDVTRLGSIEAMVSEVIRQSGRIDILVNSAGVFGLQPWTKITEAEIDRIFSVNVRGLTMVLQSVAQRMIAQGTGGAIINIASGSGRVGNPYAVMYSASKAAVISLSQSAALGLIKHKIRVNAIAPGLVLTPMWDQVADQFAAQTGLTASQTTESFARSVPFGRMAEPTDYVGPAIFLASQESEYVIGQTMNIDGGLFLN